MRAVGSRDGLELGKIGSVLVTGPMWEERWGRRTWTIAGTEPLSDYAVGVFGGLWVLARGRHRLVMFLRNKQPSYEIG